METIKLSPPARPRLAGSITVPGSKSYTNRALFLAAMTQNNVKILNPLVSNDTKAMLDCLKKLGVRIIVKNNSIEIVNSITSTANSSYDLDANESGTTIRFMLALATLIPGVKTLSGKEGLNKRPIKELVSALTQLGAKIEYLEKKGYPPVKVFTSKLSPGTIKIKGSVSSQYISALLMIAPLIGKITIEISGNQVSKPYIDMTIDIMRKFGVTVSSEKYKKYIIPANQKYNISEFNIEGDVSSASYFLAIAALTKSDLTVKNINPDSVQADMKFLKILEKMGNEITYGKNQIIIHGKGVKPVSVNMQNCPDQVQTLAVLAAFTNGKTKISGIKSLRLKETDRITALKKELKKMSIAVSSTRNTLTIHGGNPKPAAIETYNDHRMAMSFAVAGTKLAGMEINNPEVVNKTFPDFWQKLNSIGIEIQPITKNVVLIGMRGSGKTTVAKILSKKLKRDLIETDELAIKKACLTISEIVQKFGWDKFRQLETDALKKSAAADNKIISTGGGVVLKNHNIQLLKKSGAIFYLRCRPDTLIKRTGNDPGRPALTVKKTLEEEIKEVLKQRQKLYEKAADEIIDTDNLNPEEAANLILSKIKGVSVCMIIGHPVRQSLSPKMHNAGYRALGIDSRFVYVVKKVAKNNLKSALEEARFLNVRGISVTIPHKQNIIKYLDAINPVAKEIGAVNTVVNDTGKLTGFNTDWTGAITVLEKKVALKGKKAAVIGAGGAARAIVYGLIKKGAAVKIFNRSKEKAKKLGQEFGCEYNSLDALAELSNMDVIINATPVGMSQDESLIDKKFINKDHVVFDMVYTPKNTRLIKDAKAKGAEVILGYEMLLYQGIAQFELYTGMKAPIKAMRKALEDCL